jgi:hypothetical protein
MLVALERYNALVKHDDSPTTLSNVNNLNTASVCVQAVESRLIAMGLPIGELPLPLRSGWAVARIKPIYRLIECLRSLRDWQDGPPEGDAWGGGWGETTPSKLHAHQGQPLPLVSERFLAELRQVYELLQEASGQEPAAPRAETRAGADNRADKSEKKRTTIPANSNVIRLAKMIRQEYQPGIRSKNEIARDFCEGDDRKARSLLRQVRRFSYLFK